MNRLSLRFKKRIRKFSKGKTILVFLFVIFLLFEAYLLSGGAMVLIEDKLQSLSYDPSERNERISQCSTHNSLGQKQQCWDNLINSTLKNEGLTQAFSLFGVLYDRDKDFASDCHNYAHTLGRGAYKLFNLHKNIELPKMTSYCGYGFYHGFMEELIHKSGKLDEARTFCYEAEAKLQEVTNDAGGACFHGIGHGFVEDIPDPRKWGNPQAIIQNGLDVCDKISDNESTLFRCANGVFNGLAILMEQEKYELSINHTDPFAICRSQLSKHKKSCFTQMGATVLVITNNNLDQALPYISAINEDEYAIPTFTSTNLERVNLGLIDYDQTTKYCRTLPDRFYIPCIESFAESFLKYGPPENEYKKAIDYCNSSALTANERKSCFTKVTALLRNWYTKEKSLEICNSIDSKYLHQKCEDLY